MTYEQAVAWLQQFMRFAQATDAVEMLKDASDVLAVLEREHEEAERLRHLIANAYIFSVVPPIAELPEEDVTLWLKDNWSDDDIRAAIDRARKGVSDE